MDPASILFLAALECIGPVMIIFLWRKQRLSILKKCLWSAFLLIPFFGPLFYAFATLDPDEHPYESPEHTEQGEHTHHSDHSP